MKKKLTFLLVLTTVFGSYIPLVSASSNFYTPLTANTTKEVILVEDLIQENDFQTERNNYLTSLYGENYDELFVKNQLAVENAHKIESMFAVNSTGKVVYPEYIGGLYINDNDELVIQIVESLVPTTSDSNYSLYQQILAVDDNKNIEYVNYSYENLNAINELVVDNFLNNPTYNNISAVYIDVISNKVIVELKNYTEEEINKFKESIINSPLIQLVEGKSIDNNADLKAGAQYTTSLNNNCSYGYRARLSSTSVGMVTAGHCFLGNGYTVPNIGLVQKWQVGGTIDAAWIKTSTGINPTNTLAARATFGLTSPLATNVISSYIVGQRLAMVGYKSNYKSGKVTTVSLSANDEDGIAFTNLVKTDMTSVDGDSGGIVFAETATLDGYATAGVIKGTHYGYMVFSRADKINSAFGLSRY